MTIAISVARSALEMLLCAFSGGTELVWLASHEAARLGRLDDPPSPFGAGSFAALTAAAGAHTVRGWAASWEDAPAKPRAE
jgi:hypothetical protein